MPSVRIEKRRRRLPGTSQRQWNVGTVIANRQLVSGGPFKDRCGNCLAVCGGSLVLLAEDDSPVFMPPAWEVPVSMFFDEEKTIEAFRTGKGVAWDEHNERLFCGVAAFYQNAYRNSLVREWLPSLRGVEEKLRIGAKVTDVGCGHGHSTILMTEAFPQPRFWGFDYHEKSIESARSLVRNTEIGNRVSFEVASATSYPAEGFDLICFLTVCTTWATPWPPLSMQKKRWANTVRLCWSSPSPTIG